MSERYLEELHAETREELQRIDAKASVLLGLLGAATFFLAGALVVGDVDMDQLHYVLRYLFYAALAAGLAALGLITAALTPRTANPTPASHLNYFGHVSSYATVDDFRDALEQRAGNRLERLAEQTLTLSKIVRRKYRLTTVGVWCFGGATVLMVLVAMLC